MKKPQLFGICLGIGLSWVLFSMHEPLFQLWLLKVHGANPATLGWIMGVAAVASVVATLPGGWLTNRLGTRAVLIGSTALCALGFGLFWWQQSLVTATLLMCAIESGKVLVFLAAQTHIANSAVGDSSGDFGWYGAAAAMGQILGPIATGFLLERGLDFATLWVVIGLGTLVVAGLYLGRIDSGRFSHAKTATRPSLKSLFTLESTVAMIASFAVIFAIGARANFYVAFLHEHQFSPGSIGILVAVRPVAALASRLFMKQAIRWCGGNDRALAISLLVMALGLGLTPVFPEFWVQVLTGLMIGVGIGVAIPVSMASVSAGISPELRSYALGVRLTGNKAAQIVNPVLFGRVGEAAGVAASFYVGGGFLFLLCLPAFWYAQRRARLARTNRLS